MAGFILATALTALSASGAKADEWCGYAGRDNAVVECGYTTAAGCEDSVGKRGVCFIVPILRLKRRAPRGIPTPRRELAETRRFKCS